MITAGAGSTAMILVVVRTSNLAYGVGAGIILYAVLYLLKKVRIPVLHMMISAVLVAAAVWILIISFFSRGNTEEWEKSLMKNP